MFRRLLRGNTPVKAQVNHLARVRTTMTAAAHRVQLTTDEQPAYYLPNNISKDSATTASTLLQENHEKHHIFFKASGFHNHIAHHLLTIYALGASDKDLERHYKNNTSYQRKVQPLRESVVSSMRDPDKLKRYLGKEQYFHDFLQFFQEQMSQSSWQEVLNRYLFAKDDLANDLLARLFAGLLHPIIHLGFGIEFQQPAIMAEGLAEAAVHGVYMTKFYGPAEKAADEKRSQHATPIADLLDQIHDDQELREAPQWSDGNKLRDGVIARAAERMVSYTSQFHVKPEELEEKTAEMINAVAYYTGGAQRDDHQVKYDFYYMHSVNCSIFFSAFLKQDWLSDENKCRLLEWKVWGDLAMYVSRKNPDIRMDIVKNYKPKQPSDWDRIFERVMAFPDDGHASKLVRALAHGQRVCAPYDEKPEFRVKKDDWLQLGHMAIDSVEAGEPHWVRSAGFDEAWESIPRAQL